MKYKIKVKYFFYSGTFYAPKDGYLKWMDDQDLVFDTIEDAHEHLIKFEEVDCHGEENPIYFKSGTYLLAHGEYSQPEYTIVSAVTGRSSSAIRKTIQELNSCLTF